MHKSMPAHDTNDTITNPSDEPSGEPRPIKNLQALLVATAIIFIVSCAAASFPILAKRARFLKVPPVVFFLGKHFGTGVILSTAFIHLLSDAFKNLHGRRFAGYSNWPGLIVLSSVLAIFLLEYVSTVYVEKLEEKKETLEDANHHTRHSAPRNVVLFSNGHAGPTGAPPPSVPTEAVETTDERAPLIQRSHTAPHYTHSNDAYFDVYMHHHSHSHAQGKCAEAEGDAAVRLLSVLVLQLGIMIHSFVIGMTLAVTSAAGLASLLTAIFFHQLFEGLSLGVRLSTLETTQTCSSFRRHVLPLLLSLLFGITLPLGILVGIGIERMHGLDLSSEGGAWFKGTMAGCSAGLLIYAGCVELLAGDFVNDAEMRKCSAKRQSVALGSMILGAVAMALVG